MITYNYRSITAHDQIKLNAAGVCINGANTHAFYRWYATLGYPAPDNINIGVWLRGMLIATVSSWKAGEDVLAHVIASHVSSVRANGRASMPAHCKAYRPKATFKSASQWAKRRRRVDKSLHVKHVRNYGLQSVLRTSHYNAPNRAAGFRQSVKDIFAT